MGLSDLFRNKGPRVDFTPKSRNDELRAGRRLADDINGGRGRKPTDTTPSSAFMVPDDKGFMHHMKIGEDGRVCLDEEAFDKLEAFIADSKKVQEEERQARREHRKQMKFGLVGPMAGEPEVFLPGFMSSGGAVGPSLGSRMAPYSMLPTQESLRWNTNPDGFGLQRFSQRPSRLQQQHQSPFADGVSTQDFQQGSRLPFLSPTQNPFQQETLPFQPQLSQQPFQPQPLMPSQAPHNAQPFVDPLITTILPMGARGQRIPVPGQSMFDPRQFGPLNDPDANFRHLKALEKLRKENERRGGGGGGGGRGSGRRR